MKNVAKNSNDGYKLSMYLLVSFMIICPICAIFYIKERTTDAKHLQFTCGANVFIFWFTSFICDLLIYIVMSLCILITLLMFQVEGYNTAEGLGNNSVF